MALGAQTPSFIFGGNTGMSYEQLQKRRAVLDALLERQGNRAPQNVGEGIFSLAQGLTAGFQARGLKAAEKENAAAQSKIWNDLGGAMMGSGGAGAGYETATGPISSAGDGRFTTADIGSTAPVSTTPSDAGIYDDFIGSVQKGTDKLPGISNPYGLAAVAATGKHESGYSARNAFGDWSDPSESGQAGQAGGVLSWRAERLANMRNFVAANGGDPRRPSPALQAQFFLNEDPGLVSRLNAAKSPEEAQSLMNGAWKFAGYNRPGGEAARRTATARSYAPRFLGGPQTAEAQQPAAPVQVASLDPSAGMADATAAQMAPQPGNVPTPTPAASAREALERAVATQAAREEGATGAVPYTGPALNDPNAMSGIAPVGMPGADAATNAAIEQYHAGNGSAPMQYRAGPTTQTDPREAQPGSLADQVADAHIAGDPDRARALTAVPPQQPIMGASAPQQQAMAPQAPAAVPQQQAMAQQAPAPAFDPVNGVPMGGNTGAADAARAAYLGQTADPRARVAEALLRRGIAPQAAPASPSVQRVIEAQQVAQARQGQPQEDPRIGMAFRVMQNPAASPEQRSVAASILEQAQQERQLAEQRRYQMMTAQQQRAYEEQKTARQYAREDQRFGVTDAREAERLDLERQRFEREGNKRQLVDVFDETTGRSRKGYLDDRGAFVPVGGVEAPKTGGGISYTSPDGTQIQIGGDGKPLTEGQSKDVVYSTRAEGALSILDEYAPALTNRADIAKGVVPFGLGREYQEQDFQLAQQAGDEFLQAILRKDTGAAITAPEQALYGVTYLPQPGDSPALLTQKQQSRRRAVEAMKGGMSPTAIIAQERALRRTAEANAAQTPPASVVPGQDAPAAPVVAPQQQQAPAAAAPTPARPRTNGGRAYQGGVRAAPQAAQVQRATNPQTGQVLELRDGQWVPVQ